MYLRDLLKRLLSGLVAIQWMGAAHTLQGMLDRHRPLVFWLLLMEAWHPEFQSLI
jgi:hypothetical protein